MLCLILWPILADARLVPGRTLVPPPVATPAPEFKPIPEEATPPDKDKEGKDGKSESGALAEEEETPAQARIRNGKRVSGVVRIIRANPQTEVFFKDLKDSVIIPANSQHNEIYQACLQSSQTGAPVSLVIDPLSRQVLTLSKGNAPSTSGQSGSSPVSHSDSSGSSK